MSNAPDTITLVALFNRLGLKASAEKTMAWIPTTQIGTGKPIICGHITEEADAKEAVERLYNTGIVADRRHVGFATIQGFQGNEGYRPGFFTLDIHSDRIDLDALHRVLNGLAP